MSPHAVPLGCPSSPPRRDLERSLFLLPVDSIRPNPDQPRRTFGREELQELTLSIAQVGLIQPLTVRPVANAISTRSSLMNPSSAIAHSRKGVR